ncbi:hypothetical protein AVEN_54368-1 [Araneus ventricosus]|uniref:Uncharacterized protein n=1 Tax=Araneus ventricosus TaxID=182803 RepID=A0A4Y2PD09_ARAVE|nr:hypothetical protein AVEN_54368-1 [Araneus ventricosus]
MFTDPMLPSYDVLWAQMHTNNRSSCEQSSFMQSARHSLAGYGPSYISREMRRQMYPPASGTLQHVAIVCRCGYSPALRPTSSTGVLMPLVMTPQPMDDTTMHIQLSATADCLAPACNIPTAHQRIFSCKWFLLLMLSALAISDSAELSLLAN